MTDPTFVLAVFALIALTLWSAARVVSPALVRYRAARLPADVAERLLEEWLAELGHMRSPSRQLAFAVRLLCTPSRVFVDAARASASQHARTPVDVSVQIAPDAHDIGLSGSIDAALLIAPLFLAALAEWRPITLAAAGVVGSVAWVASVHVLSVGLFHATPGQWFAGLHFVTTDGGPLTWRHALRRAKPLFLIVPFMALAGAAFSLLYGAFPSQHWWIDDLIMLICVAHALVFRLVQSRRAARGVSRHTSMEICLTVKVPVVLAAPDDGPARSTSAMR